MVAASFQPDPALVARFAADLDALTPEKGPVGIAVSGGPDSLALLLLAAAARSGRIEAATVDHRLRPESSAEADSVAALCQQLGVPHQTLAADAAEQPGSSLQAWARQLRYRLLTGWAAERGLDAVATAHHLDDQAETLLMRIARGSGVGGLAGVQRSRPLGETAFLVRPLLDWRRAELRHIVEEAGIEPVDDPSNSDERFDRSRARALLRTTDFFDPQRLATVASHAADADHALDWAVQQALAERCSGGNGLLQVDPDGLPREIRRRLLARAIAILGGETPPGPKLAAALDMLDAGGTTTLAGLKLEGGARWRLSVAPARKG